MNKFKNTLGVDTEPKIPTNFNVSDFILTNHTITYDQKTIQLSNVTKISKYSFSNIIQPKFKIPDGLYSIAWIVTIVLGLLLMSGGLSSIVLLGFLISLGVVIYGFRERKGKKPIDKHYFGLIIETSSGKAENLLTNSKEFIWTLFNRVSLAMNKNNAQNVIANFNDHSFRQFNVNDLKTVYGDNFENVSDSTIFNRSSTTNQEVEIDQLIDEI